MPRGKSIPNAELLSAALEGLEAQKRRIDGQIAQVQAMLGRKRGRPAAAESPGAQSGHRRELSPAARRRIAAAQKKRWAEYRKNLQNQKR